MELVSTSDDGEVVIYRKTAAEVAETMEMRHAFLAQKKLFAELQKGKGKTDGERKHRWLRRSR